MDDIETLIADSREVQQQLQARLDQAHAKLVAQGWTPPSKETSKLGAFAGKVGTYAATAVVCLVSLAAIFASIGLAIVAFRWTAGLM